MTKQQKEQFSRLSTKQERAKFLLGVGVSTRTDIVDFDIVCRAVVGNVALPIHGKNREDVISRAVDWLKDTAGGY